MTFKQAVWLGVGLGLGFAASRLAVSVAVWLLALILRTI